METLVSGLGYEYKLFREKVPQRPKVNITPVQT